MSPSPPTPFDDLADGLSTEFIGQNCLSHAEVDSTNDLATAVAERGAGHGTLVIADRQLSGRGRFDRIWHSPPGTGAYLSIILRPPFSPRQAPPLSLVTALALSECLKAYVEERRIGIKWPNDVFIDGLKVAGILTELSASSETVHYLIVGCGININMSARDFPEELRTHATSVSLAHGNHVDRVELVRRFLTDFEREYNAYCQSGLASGIERIRRLSWLTGRRVSWTIGSNDFSGEVLGIGEDGTLTVKTDGVVRGLSCGEVSIVPER